MNFSSSKRFLLSLNYDGSNTFLFVNTERKRFRNKTISIVFRKYVKDLITGKTNKTELKEYVYVFFC